MAAQGYQESGLDQTRKSAVGAVGVMQVMPATGKDMKVGDIQQMEPNIHAGVKYIRFMMDNFYANEPMDELKTACSRSRPTTRDPAASGSFARAGETRLDENRWFNNVELLAAESIGRETVQYVSNIYKYDLAYKLLAEQQAERAKAKGGN